MDNISESTIDLLKNNLTVCPICNNNIVLISSNIRRKFICGENYDFSLYMSVQSQSWDAVEIQLNNNRITWYSDHPDKINKQIVNKVIKMCSKYSGQELASKIKNLLETTVTFS